MSDAALAKDWEAKVVAILKEREWSRVSLAKAVYGLREETAALRERMRRMEGWLHIVSEEECLCTPGEEGCPKDCERCDACIATTLLATPEADAAPQAR